MYGQEGNIHGGVTQTDKGQTDRGHLQKDTERDTPRERTHREGTIRVTHRRGTYTESGHTRGVDIHGAWTYTER